MKKAELALALVRHELLQHLEATENKQRKTEQRSSEAYLLATEAGVAFRVALDCVKDIAELMQITLKEDVR